MLIDQSANNADEVNYVHVRKRKKNTYNELNNAERGTCNARQKTRKTVFNIFYSSFSAHKKHKIQSLVGFFSNIISFSSSVFILLNYIMKNKCI